MRNNDAFWSIAAFDIKLMKSKHNVHDEYVIILCYNNYNFWLQE